MAEANLDHPGDITWFAGYGPAPVIGPCPHTACIHNLQSVIGWGPTYERYEIVRCDVPDGGCGSGCRAWVNAHGGVATAWLQVTEPATTEVAR